MTTGTGGVAVTYSRTARMVLVPPSITRQTIGVENPAEKKQKKLLNYRRVVRVCSKYLGKQVQFGEVAIFALSKG